MEEKLIDGVNETHVWASEGLPPDVTVTAVPDYCESPYRFAYAYTDDSNGIDRGIYIKASSPWTLYRFNTLTHEIGHLQRYGLESGETIAELNSLEQRMHGYILFETPPETAQWSLYNQGRWLNELLLKIYNYSSEDRTSYAQADSYIYSSLFNGFDFQALRERIGQLVELGTLEETLHRSLQEFESRYVSEDFDRHGKIEATLILKTKMSFMLNLYRQYGLEAVQQFVIGESQVPFDNGGLVQGLEGLVCADTGGRSKQEITFCCLSVEETPQPQLHFSKSRVVASITGEQPYTVTPLEITPLELDDFCY